MVDPDSNRPGSGDPGADRWRGIEALGDVAAAGAAPFAGTIDGEIRAAAAAIAAAAPADSPFHAGEQAIQAQLGVRERMADFGRRVVRDHVPEQHRHFYRQLPFLVVATVDAQGRPWAGVLSGRPGFVDAPDPRRLTIAVRPVAGDPSAQGLAVGAPVGVLGLDFATRRRNRLTAHVSRADDDGIALTVDQTFGNCPQYIQTRALEFVREPAGARAGLSAHAEATRASTSEGLSAHQQAWIRQADTFFVASWVPSGRDPVREGADASHRGGRPGFVHVAGDVLTVPDYAGNLHFNTLGNFLLNPRAGLTFVDFSSGSLLMVNGTVELLWQDDPVIAAFKGAERGWRVRVDRVVELTGALGLRWRFGEYSPNTLITGDWEQAEATRGAQELRDQWRPYRVIRVEDEARDIRSFYLEPADGHGTAPFAAWQFLPVRVPAGDAGAVVERTYTVSSAPTDAHLRISVKREAAGDGRAAGQVSTWLYEQLTAGGVLEVRAPRGAFLLDSAERRPAVLLAAGIGITPMLSMARHVLHETLRRRHGRALTVVHVARTAAERTFFGELRQLADASGGRHAAGDRRGARIGTGLRLSGRQLRHMRREGHGGSRHLPDGADGAGKRGRGADLLRGPRERPPCVGSLAGRRRRAPGEATPATPGVRSGVTFRIRQSTSLPQLCECD